MSAMGEAKKRARNNGALDMRDGPKSDGESKRERDAGTWLFGKSRELSTAAGLRALADQLINDYNLRPRAAARLLAQSASIADTPPPDDAILQAIKDIVAKDQRLDAYLHGRGPDPSAAAGSQELPLLHYPEIEPVLDTADFVEDLLIDGGMSVIYGESGCGKTFWALDLSLHVAAGRTWRQREVDCRGVLYLALEGSHGIRNRVAAFKLAHDATAVKPPFSVVPVSVNLLDPDADAARVIHAAKRAAGTLGAPIGLIVIDTLSRALAGGNENAPEDMGALVRNVDRIRQELPSHVAIVHHSGKDGARGARGHSLLRAATDTEIEVSRAPDGVSIARVTKQRELETGAEFAFRLERVELGASRRGKPVASCVVREVDPPARGAALSRAEDREKEKQEKERRARAAQDAAILDAIDREVEKGHAGATKTILRELPGLKNMAILNAVLERLEEQFVIEKCTVEKKGGQGAVHLGAGYKRVKILSQGTYA